MSTTNSTRASKQSGGQSGGRAPLGANRLPATRERRPALAALAVILILLGAAGSALIALRSGEREGFLAVSKQVEPGQKLAKSDFSSAQIAGDTAGLIKASAVDTYVGDYATTRLFKDQLVTKAMLTDAPQVPAGGALVGVSLEAGRVPSEGLRPGDIVRVIKVPLTGADGTSEETLVNAAEVTAVLSTGSDSKTTVSTNLVVNATILVPTDKLGRVAGAAAAKTLVLSPLAPSTKPEISRTGTR